MAGDSGKDKAIVVRVSGLHRNYWYVIEEKSAIDVDDVNTMIGCKSDHDRVRRLCLVNEDEEPLIYSSSLVVINSTIYLIGGDGYCPPKSDDERLAYRRLDLGGGWWRPDIGGNLMNNQAGGAAVGPDGNIYTVGYNIYRFSPHGTFHEELVFPPSRGYIKHLRLLGVTSKTLFVYFVEGGVDGANRMLGFDFESRRWDVLTDYYRGDWSAGVVLYDRYLFSFCCQDPTRLEEEEVPGIYVFDIERCQWLPKPVEGLPTDGKVLPHIFTPDPVSYMPSYYAAFLFQIGNQDPHKLALLWDVHGAHPESNGHQVTIVWAKFVLNRTTDHFCATSISSGSCPLDDETFEVINCAAGM